MGCPKWVKMDPKKPDKTARATQNGSNWTPTIQIKRNGLAQHGSRWTPRNRIKRHGLAQNSPTWVKIDPNKPDKAAWAGPKWLKMHPDVPEMLPSSPEMLARWAKMGPNQPDEAARAAQNGSRWTSRNQIKRYGLPKMVQSSKCFPRNQI